MTSTADVVVVGGGVVGASVAFHLAARGVTRVVLCERRWPAAGATGKSGALVRMHYTNEPEARLAFASLEYFQHWGDVVGAGSAGFAKTGMVRFVAPADDAKLRANVAMLRGLGVETALLEREDLRAIVPWWYVDDVAAAAYEPESGCADPVATTHGFLARARELGADVRLGTEVTAVRTSGDRVVGVDTSGGAIAAPAAVVAGGAWTVPMLRGLGVRATLQPMRTQVAVFRRPPAIETPHPVCIDGAYEMWLRPEGPNFFSTLVGISQRQEISDLDGWSEGVDGDYTWRARGRMIRRIPGMADAPMRGGWAGAITLTEDGKPVIDRHPRLAGLWFCTGDNGSSFKTAPAVGRAVAEWITDGTPRVVDLHPFRASRFDEGAPLVGAHEYTIGEPDRPKGVMLG
ncbi:MAG TPA: FAD-binding oxidoreductase [bacterium]|nr:FAD-binding oxidoreductase [bacterium]